MLLELLRLFTAVRNLYLSKEIVLCIVPALQWLIGNRTTEVLPALENVFLEGLLRSGHRDLTRKVLGCSLLRASVLRLALRSHCYRFPTFRAGKTHANAKLGSGVR